MEQLAIIKSNVGSLIDELFLTQSDDAEAALRELGYLDDEGCFKKDTPEWIHEFTDKYM